MKKIKSSTTSNQIKDGVGLGPPPMFSLEVRECSLDFASR